MASDLQEDTANTSIFLSLERMLEILADQATYLKVMTECPNCRTKVKEASLQLPLQQ